MTIMIGSARIGENRKATGGKAGDQKQKSNTNDTIGEVSMQPFYVHSKGWYILRPKSAVHAEAIANKMIVACNNVNIGYNQNDRLGVVKHGVSSNVKTNSDCSSLVRECVKEATGKDAGNFTTLNECSKLEATGLFESKRSYTKGTALYNGDVLVTKTKGHTVIVVSGNRRTASGSTVVNSNKSWKGNENYYLENELVGQWQKAMNKGFDTKELEVDDKFGAGSQEFARTHLLWSGQKHNCITAIRWLRKTLRDVYGFSKLSYDEGWTDYLSKCVGVFQEDRNLEVDKIVGLEVTYWLLSGVVK